MCTIVIAPAPLSRCIIGQKGASPGSVPEALVKSNSGAVDTIRKELVFAERSSADVRGAADLSFPYPMPNAGKWLRRRLIDGALQR